MRFLILCIINCMLFFSCKKDKGIDNSIPLKNTTPFEIKYAKGFTITNFESYKEIKVISPWPDSKETFHYYLVKKGKKIPSQIKNNIIIKTPIEKVVAMSTTNIPALEYLSVDDRLVGFPNTKFISSKRTKERIDNGFIKDLNNNLDINMELLLDLQPELVIGFSVNGNNKVLNQIEKFKIPVVLDGAWTEQHPLGRAEWIKFIGAFFDKEKEADSIFKSIEINYIKAKEMALKSEEKPIVLSGSMFKDVWNIPGGKSFIAKYLEDANTDYLWKNNKSNGSLQLNFENVLEKGRNAKLWIGAGAFQNKEQMKAQHKGYTYFEAYKNNSIYSYTKQDYSNSGILFYELGPLRPDIILKDIINIAHPELLPNYESFFYKRLD
ncbi:ABC transporter substrate-binding protein [Seonamhaeicola maritimus]|uniref:ABC transporter substrate-binding protein n=1 Tax=Seonamhaeicola maritimus TaxID=2591822 RepID=UPI0024952BF6|nr:ABC transporter substrate-binding protein [Seonamhaeicola maritimus]